MRPQARRRLARCSVSGSSSPRSSWILTHDSGSVAEPRISRRESAPMSFLRKDSMVYKDLGERDYAAGETIIREGDTSTEMFIIQEGKVAVTKRIGDNEVFLATLQRGDFFGEMSLLESLPRNATVRALTETTLVAIRAVELLMKFRRDS